MRKLIKEAIWGILIGYFLFSIFCFIVIESVYGYYQKETDGQVIVAVIDTGVNEQHPLFHNRLIYPYDVQQFKKHTIDENGHGTHMAGIIARLTEKTKIMPIKIMKGDGSPSKPTAIAVWYSILKGADVVNMSFSHENERLLHAAIWYGRKKGVLFVSSTGNEREDNTRYPARIKGVIGVAGVDKHHRLYQNSNIGRETIFAAPAVNVSGANHAFTSKKDEMITKSGTSASSAYLTAVIAYLLEQNPNRTQREIETELEKLSIPVANNQQRPVDSLHSISIEKIKASYEDNLYIGLQSKQAATEKNKETIYIDNWGVEKVRIRDADGYQFVPLIGQTAVEVSLKEGYNEIEVYASEDNKGVSETITLLKDSEAPFVLHAEHSFQKNNQGYEIFVCDYTPQNDIWVDGEKIKTHMLASIKDTSGEVCNRLFFESPEKEKIQLTVKDDFGHETSLEVEQTDD